jgi:hypothetical protein
MKNAFKLFGIIAIIAVIGFWAVSCEDDDGGGNAILGNNITSGAEVVYDSSIKNLTEAKKATNFSFVYDHDVRRIRPLNDFLDGSPSVTISDNKVTIILGTPKSAYLNTLSDELIEKGITVNPSNAKFFEMDFSTSDNKYSLFCMKDDKNGAVLSYADRDVTIKGTFNSRDDGEEYKYNMSLKKGWNYLFSSYNEKTKTSTATSSTTQPSGYKWTVRDN